VEMMYNRIIQGLHVEKGEREEQYSYNVEIKLSVKFLHNACAKWNKNVKTR
jgi:hypothetical protein